MLIWSLPVSTVSHTSLFALNKCTGLNFLWHRCLLLDSEAQFLVHLAQDVSKIRIFKKQKSRTTVPKNQIWVADLSFCISPGRIRCVPGLTGHDSPSSSLPWLLIKYSSFRRCIRSALTPFSNCATPHSGHRNCSQSSRFLCVWSQT